VAGLLGLAHQPAAAQGKDVVVFAAASLKNAIDDINAQWRRETGKKATVSYAGSPALARQIEQGAPADLFISADLSWMDYLQQRNLIKPKTRGNLLGNRIVLIAGKDSRVATKLAPGVDLAGLLGSGRLAMADVKAVPAGRYGKAALEALKIWPAVEGRIAQAENVRAALLLVSRGEAPLGIVYRTDAAADPNVKIIDVFPENTHPPIIYPAAVTAGSTHPDAAAFLAYLKSPSAKPLFEKQGFAVLGF
jgi:molybdate transport system substrate-binding protein